MPQPLTGIVLAGGKSRRFGRDKALIKLSDKTAVELAVELVRPFVQHMLLSTNEPAMFSFLAIPAVPDLHAYAGPLAGIEATLRASRTEWNLVVACDMPRMSPMVLEFLSRLQPSSDAVLFSLEGIPQFFPGLYHRKILEPLEPLFAQPPSIPRERSLYALLHRINAQIVPAETLPFFNPKFFFNMNTPEDYHSLFGERK
ncbi:MAG: molybdenum cofactor guanylyltransferase [candidate division KSB1 bacterium]|nr:molybdenum cofactor guanylyltransferase [candidate division KSB1 bacterium]MDZ7345682.1 molybdenum cofactor guanylyltransferase [candidate division KSB1 bacterium]